MHYAKKNITFKSKISLSLSYWFGHVQLLDKWKMHVLSLIRLKFSVGVDSMKTLDHTAVMTNGVLQRPIGMLPKL